MADLDSVRRLVAQEQGLAVVSTTRTDGSVQASVVNAGVLAHPNSGEDVVGFVVRGDALKLRHVRARPRIAVTFRSGWEWVGVEGDARAIGPDDPVDGVDVPTLLRDVFTAAGGSHDDWDTYDRVMADERRCAVLVTPQRIYGVAP